MSGYVCTRFTAYLEEIQSVRRHTNSISDPKNTNLPVLVHCSAGVGRTGVVLLSEILIACLEYNEVRPRPNTFNLHRIIKALAHPVGPSPAAVVQH